MTDQELRRLFERAANKVHVNPPRDLVPKKRLLSSYTSPQVLTVAASIVLLTTGSVFLARTVNDSNTQPAVDNSATQSAIPTAPLEELTGKDVGLALGLTPIEGGYVEGCSAYSSYKGGDDPAGFCLDGVTDDEVEETTLLLQIHGYRRTELLQEYAAAMETLEDAANGSDSAEVQRLTDQVRALEERLDAEQGSE